MGDETKVTVRGYDELAAGSKQLAQNIDETAARELERLADQTAGRVRGSVPRLTGRLAGSVIARGSPASVSMGEGVPYARFVEFVGRGHPSSAQGNYLYPAALEAAPLVVDAAEQAAETEIGRMRWPSPT